MKTTDVAVIGDLFMRSDYFVDALAQTCADRVTCRTLDLQWPDQPMAHKAGRADLAGLHEYMGVPEDIIAHVGAAPVLVTHLAPLSRTMFEAMPHLKLLAVARGGPVNIDMKAAADHGVQVVNAPGRNASAVAEFTIGAILAETRNITRGHDALRRGVYRGDLYRADIAGDELSEMTVGIIGYGDIGRRVVRLLRAFGTKVMVADPYVTLTDQDAADENVIHCGLEPLLSASDVVSLHPRVTDETRNMIDAAALDRMKPSAILVNTARGPLMDYDALYAALSRGHLRGAMLETFAVEPTPVNLPLLKLPNVTLTPHIAGASRTTIRNAAGKAATEVQRWLDGAPPLNPC